MKLRPGDDDYPTSLYCLDEPPALRVSGPLVARRAVAVVGSRSAPPGALRFAHSVAYHLARADVVVVSGGALGVDRAAHEGAMAGGATWLVCPTGRDHVYPRVHRELFARIAAAPASRVVWPFEDSRGFDETTPRLRNGVLVGLAECVVVIQARARSGSRNAATWARNLGRPRFIVPGPPYDYAFEGSLLELLDGARPVWSIPTLFEELGLPPPDMSDPAAVPSGKLPHPRRIRRAPVTPQTYMDPPTIEVDRNAWSRDENIVFSSLSGNPIQQDLIVARTGLGASATLTALLTLSLKDVVVEGPDGFFRRRNAL